MPKRGIPTVARKRSGEAIRDICKEKHVSLEVLNFRLFRQCSGNEEPISLYKLKDWVAGKLALDQTTHEEIEKVCTALNCTLWERASILLAADRTIFPIDAVSSPVAQLVTYIAAQIYEEAQEPLSDLLASRVMNDLDADELKELVQTALTLFIRQHQQP